MAFSSWRGVVGMINPTLRPGVTEEVIRLLPEGIGLIPLFLNVRRGTADEFETLMPAYEELVAVLAECGCDLIHPHGAPPFMVQGRRREAEIIKTWERKYKTPIMSVAQNHVNALKTLKAKTIIGATYFPPNLNACRATRSMLTSSAIFSGRKAPTRSTCSAPAGARSTSSRRWSRTCRCPWCIR
jgi:maleate cis-trans isomerase